MKTQTMKLLIFGALILSLQATAETMWTWSGTGVDQIGACTSLICTFTLTETSGTGASLSGTFARPATGIPGFMDLLVTSNTPSAGGWDIGTITNNVTHLYGTDIPGVIRLLQPLIAEDYANPVIFAQPVCPTVPAGGLLFNWGWGHWNAIAGSNNVTSAAQVVGGTINIASNNQISIPNNFAMTTNSWVTGPLPSALPLTSAPGPVCGAVNSGAFLLTGSGDRGGNMYYSGSPIGNGVIVYKTGSGHTVLGAIQSSISSIADISGPYAGFAYDTLQNSGLNGTASTHMVKLTVSSNGCATSSACAGTPIDTSGNALTYMNGALNLQVVSLNSVASTTVPGMFQAKVYDGAGTPNVGLATCELIYSMPSASNTPPNHNVIFCQAQMPGAVSTACNLFLTSVSQVSGAVDSSSGLSGANGSGNVGGGAGYIVEYAGSAGATPSYAMAIAQQADEKILVSGINDASGTTSTFSVSRFNLNGSFDTTWNSGTATSVTPGELASHSLAMTLDSSNRAVVAGDTEANFIITFYSE